MSAVDPLCSVLGCTMWSSAVFRFQDVQLPLYRALDRAGCSAVGYTVWHESYYIKVKAYIDCIVCQTVTFTNGYDGF